MQHELMQFWTTACSCCTWIVIQWWWLLEIKHTTPQRTHTAKQKLERRYHVTTFLLRKLTLRQRGRNWEGLCWKLHAAVDAKAKRVSGPQTLLWHVHFVFVGIASPEEDSEFLLSHYDIYRGHVGQPSIIRLLCRIFFRQIAILAATNPVKMALVR